MSNVAKAEEVRETIDDMLFQLRGGKVSVRTRDGETWCGYIYNRIDGQLLLTGAPWDREGLVVLSIDDIEELEVVEPPKWDAAWEH